MQQTKALVLFSGGLDSILAARTLMEQSIAVTPLCFTSPFYGCEKAVASAKVIGLECRVEDISGDMLSLVKNPPNGYGKHLNPCIDCHSTMVRKAGEIMKREAYDIIATGEVLGQRPFSQNRDALDQVSRLAGVEILRPLSAKRLAETSMEKEGLVIRGKLHDLEGRRREGQMELVRKYSVIDYPSPAGGCLLTDPGYSERLMKLLDYWPDCSPEDAALLKYGRVFWFTASGREKLLLLVGRHFEDNEALIGLKKDTDIRMELVDMNGPTSILRSKSKFAIKEDVLQLEIPKNLRFSTLHLDEAKQESEIIGQACLITAYYATKARGHNIKCRIVV